MLSCEMQQRPDTGEKAALQYVPCLLRNVYTSEFLDVLIICAISDAWTGAAVQTGHGKSWLVASEEL